MYTVVRVTLIFVAACEEDPFPVFPADRELAFLHASSTEGPGVWVLAAFCEVSLKDVQC
jgi:hypothetical protein